MSNMDRVCKNCGKTKRKHYCGEDYWYCIGEGTTYEPADYERVPVGFVDAVRKLVNAVWNDVDGGSIRLDKALQSIESMLSDMDKKEDV